MFKYLIGLVIGALLVIKFVHTASYNEKQFEKYQKENKDE